MSAVNTSAFFHHNPPHDAADQKDLFVDRLAELVLVRERIIDELPCIRAIHGGSRVGKSHLAIHVLKDLEPTHHIFRVIAAGGYTARRILKDLYREIRQAVYDVKEPRLLEPEGVGTEWLLGEAIELIRLVDAVVPEIAPERPLEATVARTLEKTDTLAFAKGVLSLTLAGKESRGETLKVLVSPPDDYGLCEVIRRLCDILFYVTGKRCLLYVDDIDLLDVGAETPQEVVLLVRLLYQLAVERTQPPSSLKQGAPLPIVMASLRTRSLSINHKEMSELVQVRPLPRAEFRKVYRTHVQKFNQGQDVFDEACLEELINYTYGEIGTFLWICRRFFSWGRMRHIESGATGVMGLLGREDFLQYLKEELGDLLRDPDLADYMEKIMAALSGNQLQVSLDRGVLKTDLVRWILDDPAHSLNPQQYRIKGLAASLLRLPGKTESH